jgi:hypothetical protein
VREFIPGGVMQVDILQSLASGFDLAVRATLLLLAMCMVGLLLWVGALQRDRRPPAASLQVFSVVSRWFVAGVMVFALLCMQALGVVRYLQQRDARSSRTAVALRER